MISRSFGSLRTDVVDKDKVPDGLDMLATTSPKVRAHLNSFKAMQKNPNFSPTFKAALDILLNGLEPIGDVYKKAQVEYLDHTYQEMFDVSSYYTGNLRGSLDIDGDIEKDAYHTDIDVNMEVFLEPKTLKNLREVEVSVTYMTKRGEVTREYDYGIGRITKNVGGFNYIPIQDPINVTSRPDYREPRTGGPFVEKVWVKVIKERNRKNYIIE